MAPRPVGPVGYPEKATDSTYDDPCRTGDQSKGDDELPIKPHFAGSFYKTREKI